LKSTSAHQPSNSLSRREEPEGEPKKKKKEEKKRTVPLSNSVVQGRLPRRVGRVDGAAVLEQQVEHGHRADGGGAVQRVLAALVADAGRRRGRVGLEELAGQVEVGFGG
jgi:hypothetical protein